MDNGFFIKEFRDFGSELYILAIPLLYILQVRLSCYRRFIPTYPEIVEMKGIKIILPSLFFRFIIYYLMSKLSELEEYAIDKVFDTEHEKSMFVLLPSIINSLFWAILVAGGPYDYVVGKAH